MCKRIAQNFPSRPESIAAARSLAVAALGDWEDVDAPAGRAFLLDILLIVSELTTNATQATAEDFRLTLRQGADYVEIAVEDSDPRPARLVTPRPDQISGRGLALVAALSASWGQETYHGNGKKVWARVARPPAESDHTRSSAASPDPPAPGVDERTLRRPSRP